MTEPGTCDKTPQKLTLVLANRNRCLYINSIKSEVNENGALCVKSKISQASKIGD